MRRLVPIYAAFLVGCGPHQDKVSRVRLTLGLPRPGTAKPDPVESVIRKANGDLVVSAGGAMAAEQGIVVEGVCREGQSGDGVGCWNVAGQDVPALAREVIEMRERALFGTEPTGSRARFFVVRLPMDTEQTQIALVSISGKPAVPVFQSGEGATRRHVFSMQAPDGLKRGSANFVQTTQRQEKISLPLRKGGAALSTGYRLSVESIGRLVKGPFEGWRIVVHQTGSGRFVPAEKPPLVMPDGRRFRLRNGRIEATDAFRLLRLDERVPDGFALAIDRDPAKIDSITLGIEDAQRIELTGIPFEPN